MYVKGTMIAYIEQVCYFKICMIVLLNKIPHTAVTTLKQKMTLYLIMEIIANLLIIRMFPFVFQILLMVLLAFLAFPVISIIKGKGNKTGVYAIGNSYEGHILPNPRYKVQSRSKSSRETKADKGHNPGLQVFGKKAPAGQVGVLSERTHTMPIRLFNQENISVGKSSNKDYILKTQRAILQRDRKKGSHNKLTHGLEKRQKEISLNRTAWEIAMKIQRMFDGFNSTKRATTRNIADVMRVRKILDQYRAIKRDRKLLHRKSTSSNKVWPVPSKRKSTKRSPKLILPWNLYYGSSFYNMGTSGISEFCPHSQCYVSTDKSLLFKADAVIFHMWPADKWTAPTFRLPHQKYVFLLNESPARHDYQFDKFDNFFNLTMTYRLDSDIPFLYGSKHKRRPSNNYEPFILKTLKTKTKPVVWVVSHCQTDSKREEYVKELSKHIEVDIYGHCGNLTCRPARSNKCYNHFGHNYKFVLSFENSICKDYITEKVYEAIRGDIVPVVFGGADYKNLLPPNSYINVADFETPKHLADYLLGLHHNDAEYLKFFEWKDHFILSDGHETEFLCSL